MPQEYHTVFSATSGIQVPRHPNNQNGCGSQVHWTHARIPAPDDSYSVLPSFPQGGAHIGGTLPKLVSTAAGCPARALRPVYCAAKFPDARSSASAAASPSLLPDLPQCHLYKAYPAHGQATQKCRRHPQAPDWPMQRQQLSQHLPLPFSSVGHLPPRQLPATGLDCNLRQTGALIPARTLFSASDTPYTFPPSSFFCS